MEDVGGRGVVHDDDLVQVPAQATQVLHVVAAVEDAGLPEKAAAEGAPLVQEVGDRVCILPPQRKCHLMPACFNPASSNAATYFTCFDAATGFNF